MEGVCVFGEIGLLLPRFLPFVVILRAPSLPPSSYSLFPSCLLPFLISQHPFPACSPSFHRRTVRPE